MFAQAHSIGAQKIQIAAATLMMREKKATKKFHMVFDLSMADL